MNEPELIATFRQQQKEAFRYLWDNFYPSLCIFSHKITGNQQESEDIASETLLKLFERSDRFDTMRGIRAFLFITARNASIDYWRRMKKQSTGLQEFTYLSAAGEALANDVMIQEAILQEIYEHINALPPRGKTVMLLWLKGMSYQEMAAALELDVQTIRNTHANAVKKLAEKIKFSF
jgi:RNA polymerase sigma factor (sigma-70 family)